MSDSRPIRTRRLPRCGGCGLPPLLCLCAEIPRLQIRSTVVVVAHRFEWGKPTNTGRLVVAALAGARVRLHGVEGPERDAPAPSARRLVLYPLPGARVLQPGEPASELVVPDGTWSQARRIVRRDALCREAEAVALPAGAPGRYALRRSLREGGLCTLEAVARALGLLEGPEVEQALTELLERFVERSERVRALGTQYRPPG
ncbi:MAG: DTW domain-containing protein [Deltaproteobacteria bacterium]|nr:DTW domain-containing protein [Deltaproteobacteria bacterium]